MAMDLGGRKSGNQAQWERRADPWLPGAQITDTQQTLNAVRFLHRPLEDQDDINKLKFYTKPPSWF